MELLDKEELQKRLDRGDYEGHRFIESLETNKGVPHDLTEFPGRAVVIFKGTTVVPKPVEKVTRHELA